MNEAGGEVQSESVLACWRSTTIIQSMVGAVEARKRVENVAIQVLFYE